MKWGLIQHKLHIQLLGKEHIWMMSLDSILLHTEDRRSNYYRICIQGSQKSTVDNWESLRNSHWNITSMYLIRYIFGSLANYLSKEDNFLNLYNIHFGNLYKLFQAYRRVGKKQR